MAGTKLSGVLPPVGRLVVAVLLTVVAGSSGVQATAGQLHCLSGAGLAMTVDTRWLPGSGYRPVPIEVTPLQPMTADRLLQIELLLRDSWMSSGYDVRVAQALELPAGSPGARITLRVPQSLNQLYRINVLEDGQLVNGLTQNWVIDPDVDDVLQEGLPRVLVVGQALPNADSLIGLLTGAVTGGRQVVRQYGMPSPAGSTLTTIRNILPNELPDQWLDYTNLDVVCLSIDQWSALQRTVPGRAILRWTRAGGNLFVYGIGRQWQRLNEVEASLRLAPAETTPNAASPDRSWIRPDKKLFAQPLSGFLSEDMGYYGPVAVVEADSENAEQPKPPLPPDEPHFLYQEYGLGMVVALAPEDPFAGSLHDWQWVFNALGADRLLWTRRHGISRLSDNPDFWNFLIPGIGLPPVTAFRVLITLFVVVIGPVNYFILRRWGRLYLLLVVVPGSAAAVTLALLGYGVVADGLETRVRVRSITEIDQRSGEAVCWSRLSYYAGLTPRGGLVFSGDVAVLPLEYTPAAFDSRGRDLLWDQQQRLTRGWLRPRTPAQFVTVRARKTSRNLRVFAAPDKVDALKVENRLGAKVLHLLLRNEAGDYFAGEGLAAGATRSLEPADPADWAGRLAQIAVDQRPEFPPGTDRQSLTTAANRSSFRRYRYYWGRGHAVQDPTQASSRLEQVLASLHGRGSAAGPLLEPAGYIAIVDRSPEVELGTSLAREKASYHVILGNW